MRRLLVLCLLGAWPNAARAFEARLLGEPLRLDLTETVFAQWRGDPGNGDASQANYGELTSRLNVQAAWRDFVFAVRVDSSGYLSPPQPGESIPKPGAPNATPRPVKEFQLRNRFRQAPWDPNKFVEKVSLGYQGRRLEATLGDFYASFGRGLVLSIRKVDELGQDTTILGGKATVRAGPFTGTALAGVTNVQNVDETTARYTADPFDRLGAARLEARLFDKVNLGVHGLVGRPATSQSPISAAPDRYVRAGFTLDAPRPVNWLALYAEYARREDRIADAAAPGSALYGSATAYAGPVTLLAEAKAYDAYAPWKASTDTFNSLLYQQPPTLERIVTQMSNNTDIRAGRLRADWTIRRGVVAYASAEYGRILPMAAGGGRVLYDAYLGGQFFWGASGAHVFPLVAYREERERKDGALEERLVAFEGVFAQPLGASFSTEAQWMVWRREKLGVDPWLEGQAYLSLKSVPKVVAAVGYEFTTAQVESLNKHHFLNGTVQWNITPGTSLRLFAGGQRPGLKCISGLCRVFPAMQGARLELVVRG